jgi:histidinol-phosphatase (PHP family)
MEIPYLSSGAAGHENPLCDFAAIIYREKGGFAMTLLSNTPKVHRQAEQIQADTHVHTEFSGDSETPVRRQIDQAVRLGMTEICITDHHDPHAPSQIDFNLDLERYVPAIQAIREEYRGRIKVRLGIELGLQLHLTEELARLTSTYPFDYVIGSNHFVDQMDPYFPAYFEGKTEEQGYRRYFEATLKRVQGISDFDVLGHLDYVVRYGPNQNRDYSYKKYGDIIDPILKNLTETGRGLECNTGGYKYGLGHPNPAEDVLKRYLELGGEIITIGSDAHEPKHLGFDFARARRVLKDIGFRYYAVYESRKPHFYSL